MVPLLALLFTIYAFFLAPLPLLEYYRFLLAFLFSISCQVSFKFADFFLTEMCIKPLYFVILI